MRRVEKQQLQYTHVHTYRDTLVVGPSLIIQLMWSGKANGRRTGWTATNLYEKRKREREKFDRVWLSRNDLSGLSLRLFSQNNRNIPKREHTYTYDYTHVCSCVCVPASSCLNCTCANEGKLCKNNINPSISPGVNSVTVNLGSILIKEIIWILPSSFCLNNFPPTLIKKNAIFVFHIFKLVLFAI